MNLSHYQEYTPTSTRVGIGSVNQTVGDWSGNRQRIIQCIVQASTDQVKLLLLPEMAISGYSLGDRLARRGTLLRSYECLTQIAIHVKDMIVCVGLPIEHRGVIYNAVAVIAHQKIIGFGVKEHLATGDVEYENRWYQPWPHGRVDEWQAPDGHKYPIGHLIFQAKGLGRFAFEICEDAWKGIRPGSLYSLAGAELILNPSASWFTLGKQVVRRRMITQISREDHCVYLYSSLLGCDDTRLIFDGSAFIAVDGQMIKEGDRFRFDKEPFIVHADVDLSALRQSRREEGSWRQQVAQFEQGLLGAIPKIIDIDGDFKSHLTPSADPAYWLPPPTPEVEPSLTWLVKKGLVQAFIDQDIPHLELELAICLALRDYTRKANVKGFALALSGGRDSAMIAILVDRMFRYDQPHLKGDARKQYIEDRFLMAYLATDNSGNVTRHAAQAVSAEIGAKFYDLNIQETLSTELKLIQEAIGRNLTWENPVDDIALQNVQARLRGNLIWFLANLRQALLLSTSNQSEVAVGYATMDGDTSGGLSPIANVPKSLVKLWLNWAEKYHTIDSLKFINKQEPTAELRPVEQTDEADLMPFEVLDRILYGFVQKAQDPLDLFLSLWPQVQKFYQTSQGADPYGFSAHIRKFVRMFCFAQWKRERFAISFRLTSFDLDPKAGGRFPVIQSPFIEELKELDDYLAEKYPR
jgi:NAD+ synthase (glutamine-hydrolysing)